MIKVEKMEICKFFLLNPWRKLKKKVSKFKQSIENNATEH